MDKRERASGTSLETLGRYEYDSKERLGYGAFAIVFKGWMKEVSYFHTFFLTTPICH